MAVNGWGGFHQMTSLSGETYASGTSTVIPPPSSGTIDVQLAVASQYLELRFYARGNQTPTEDGAYFGQFTSPEVYPNCPTSTSPKS